MTVLLGAIADDFTGATDLANTLVAQGMRVTQVIGIPDGQVDIGDAQAVVVALKSRTEPVADAVSKSVAALQWLQSLGARQYFFKYCSTFDSTDQGNIGPVADALMDALDGRLAFVCPAFPTNGRTVYQGNLFVGDQLLSESPMKDHPLTPMRDANLLRLMSAQSRGKCALIPLQTVLEGDEAIAAAAARLEQKGFRYAIVDAVTDENLWAIGAAASQHRLVTGGSGIALGLPANFRRENRLQPGQAATLPSSTGRRLVLAGSCSTATRAQIAYVRDAWPQYKINVDDIAAGIDVSDNLIAWALEQPADYPVLIYASADPDEVGQMQARYGAERAGKMVEDVLAAAAIGLVAQGFSQLLVAGGETSGAVVTALGIDALRIGPQIDPGVPWTESTSAPRVALALKSGNFGGEEFFEKAFTMLS